MVDISSRYRTLSAPPAEVDAANVVLCDAHGNMLATPIPVAVTPTAGGGPIPATLTDSAGNPLGLVVSAGFVRVAGQTLHVSTNPVLTVAATYVTGDYVGTSAVPWSWLNAFRTLGGTGVLQSMLVIDKSAATVAGELWLFDRPVTVPADSAAWTITDADAQFLLGVIPTGTYYSSAANSISVAPGLSLPIWAYASTTLYGAFVTRGSPSYASGDLTVVLGIKAD